MNQVFVEKFINDTLQNRQLYNDVAAIRKHKKIKRDDSVDSMSVDQNSNTTKQNENELTPIISLDINNRSLE